MTCDLSYTLYDIALQYNSDSYENKHVRIAIHESERYFLSTNTTLRLKKQRYT